MTSTSDMHAAPDDRIDALTQELESTRRDLARKQAEVEDLYREVRMLAINDPLTGLLNRRGVHELGGRELQRARRLQRPLAACMVHVDGFAELVRTHGPAVGDGVLGEVGRRCRGSLRAIDLIGRSGGASFPVLLPETSLEQARLVGERLRATVDAPITLEDGRVVSVTISLGVSVLDADMQDLDDLLDDALGLLESEGGAANAVRSRPG